MLFLPVRNPANHIVQGVVPDLTHPVVSRFKGFFLPGISETNLINRQGTMTNGATLVRSVTSPTIGFSATMQGNTSAHNSSICIDKITTYPITIVFVGRVTSTSFSPMLGGLHNGGTINTINQYFFSCNSTTNVNLVVRNNNGTQLVLSAAVPGGAVAGKDLVIIAQSLSNTNHRICVNGSSVITSSTDVGSIVTTWNSVRFGTPGSSNNSACGLFAVGQTPFTDEEMIYYSGKISRIFEWLKHPDTFLFIPEASGNLIFDLGVGSYTLSGSSIGFNSKRILSGNTGAYALSGNNVSLLLKKLLDLSVGSYSLSGNNVSINVKRVLSGNTGAYSISGNDVNQSIKRILSLNSGVYGLTGDIVSETAKRLLSNNIGAYSISGNDIEFVIGDTNLALDVGSYGISGSPIGFNVKRILSATTGSYSISGNSVGQDLKRLLSLSIDNYSLSGNDVSINAKRVISGNTGAYSISGNDVNISAKRIISLNTGSYVLNGISLGINSKRILSLNTGAYTLTGNIVNFVFIPVGGGVVYPNVADVRYGVIYGPANSLVGTFKFNPSFDIFKSNRISPSVYYVLIGSSGAVVGQLPAESDVRKGVQYGIAGEQFTGTAIGFNALDTTTALIIKPITENKLISV